MVVNIFDSIGKWFQESYEELESFVIQNGENPLFWVFVVVFLLGIAWIGLRNLSNN